MTALAIRSALVCARDGPLAVRADRWLATVTPADASVLARVHPPTLDVGCGPGRHVLALAERGTRVLGIDVTPRALDTARARGAPVLERSVFERVPGAGRWGSALLLDGNIGLGGDPVTLLRRVASLLRGDGIVLVELDHPGTARVTRRVRLEIDGTPGPWFELTNVPLDTLEDVAHHAALTTTDRWSVDERWFATLTRIRR